MKKVLLLVCVIITVMLASCDSSTEKMYSEEEMREAIYEAEQRAFEEGYAYAEYYFRPDLLEEEAEYAYEAGYERGYDEGYHDCLKEYGLVESTFDPNNRPRIEKDRD